MDSLGRNHAWLTNLQVMFEDWTRALIRLGLLYRCNLIGLQ